VATLGERWGGILSDRTRPRTLARFAACLLPSILGCARIQLPAPQFDSLPIRSVSRDELVAQLQQESAAVTRLKGKLEIGMAADSTDDYRRCRAVLASQSPWNGTGVAGLYLQGYRQLIPTLFTLVSDGRTYWLHIPHDNIVYTGPVDGPHPVRKGREIRLDAADLFRALFVQPFVTDSLQITEEAEDYTVTLHTGGRVERRLWIERRLLSVRREVYYGAAGEPQLEIDRDPPADFGGSSYPARVVVRDLESGDSVLLEFESVTVNPEKLAEGLFLPKLPEGVIVDHTDEDGGRT